jgi:hypothetical protein
LISLFGAACKRIDGFHNFCAEARFCQSLEGPTVSFFHNIMEEADNAFVIPFDSVGNALAMGKIRLTCLVGLSRMSIEGDLDGPEEIRRPSMIVFVDPFA